ncbi:hypothetical protein [Neorhodopirellula lusitana]|uniref:hypothetical protein n=1 Tax=Neorhodopirellula lusitana TaxID=445327 RepID=UPI003850DF49
MKHLKEGQSFGSSGVIFIRSDFAEAGFTIDTVGKETMRVTRATGRKPRSEVLTFRMNDIPGVVCSRLLVDGVNETNHLISLVNSTTLMSWKYDLLFVHLL